MPPPSGGVRPGSGGCLGIAVGGGVDQRLALEVAAPGDDDWPVFLV